MWSRTERGFKIKKLYGKLLNVLLRFHRWRTQVACLCFDFIQLCRHHIRMGALSSIDPPNFTVRRLWRLLQRTGRTRRQFSPKILDRPSPPLSGPFRLEPEQQENFDPRTCIGDETPHPRHPEAAALFLRHRNNVRNTEVQTFHRRVRQMVVQPLSRMKSARTAGYFPSLVYAKAGLCLPCTLDS